MIKRAIISVSDKTGIVPLARELSDLGIEIVSTGGTAKQLNEAGIPVIPIDQVTGYPECLDGRVKTLHPRIHGGILAMRDHPDHMQTLRELEITPIDLVVINLYPFRETVQKPDATLADCIENIDIGGPGMLRAAAKNYRDVTVMTDPADYEPVLSQLRENGQTTESLRFELACKVFEHTAAYDALIAGYLAAKLPQERSPAK
ncbi:MAG: bifunctional phosphoribosylaminoimidazolecarboxamide formyltransferase/IMP cyclohydrolase, partial [Eubacteriales bacterium]|nr:bifunctional phosphoribosylaminoimidazolecarboxamide formyltransferase/IMP cyclohydrolase [Eubacteriales bacterium]